MTPKPNQRIFNASQPELGGSQPMLGNTIISVHVYCIYTKSFEDVLEFRNLDFGFVAKFTEK